MDNSMRFAALRALENAEQAAKERHAAKVKHLQEMMEEQTEEVKSILFMLPPALSMSRHDRSRP